MSLLSLSPDNKQAFPPFPHLLTSTPLLIPGGQSAVFPSSPIPRLPHQVCLPSPHSVLPSVDTIGSIGVCCTLCFSHVIRHPLALLLLFSLLYPQLPFSFPSLSYRGDDRRMGRDRQWQQYSSQLQSPCHEIENRVSGLAPSFPVFCLALIYAGVIHHRRRCRLSLALYLHGATGIYLAVVVYDILCVSSGSYCIGKWLQVVMALQICR